MDWEWGNGGSGLSSVCENRRLPTQLSPHQTAGPHSASLQDRVGRLGAQQCQHLHLQGQTKTPAWLKKETPYSCSVHHWGEKKKPKKSRHSQWLFGVGVEPGPKNGLAEPSPPLRPPHPRLLAHSFKSPVIKNQRNICSNNQRPSKELTRWAKQ